MADHAQRHQITIPDLERWKEHGAIWRALAIEEDRVVVELCTCFGEPVDVVESNSAETIAFVRDHRSSESDE
jgi:hypothetical protein